MHGWWSRLSLYWRWNILVIIALIADSSVIPVILNVLHVPWYASVRHGGVDNLDSFELAFALTVMLVWFTGTAGIFISNYVSQRGKRK